MSKSRDDECFKTGVQLAIFCIYFHDENKSFRDYCRTLDRKLQNALLHEIVFFRIYIVVSSVIKLIEDEYKCSNVLDGFFETIKIGLKLDSSSIDDFLTLLEYDYAGYDPEEISINTILENLDEKGIEINLTDEEKIKINLFYLTFQVQECKSLTRDIIEYLLASPEKKELMNIQAKLLLDQIENPKKKSGCLGSVLALVFVICFLTYVV